MQELKLSIPKTFRYFTEGQATDANDLLLVLHGYGQLPAYFIRKFACLSENYFVVAPEGMHRFYLKGSEGRVGASWMTKEAREDDISDNMQYLDQLLDELQARHAFGRVILLGFSQGGATAARYFCHRPDRIHQLILWGSVFPPDVELPGRSNERAVGQSMHFAVGDQDEYFPEEKQKQLLEYFQSIGFKTYLYDGGHDIHCDTLLKILG